MRSLESYGLRWLRFEKRCRVALFERSPRPMCGQPDVLGITDNRYLLEIEVKRSLSDFRANEKKFHILNRELYLPRWPKRFWFLVPPELAERVRPMLPDYAGLLRGPTSDEVQQLVCVQQAPVNKASEPLTTKEMVRLAQCMANQILSNQDVIDSIRRRCAELEADAPRLSPWQQVNGVVGENA